MKVFAKTHVGMVREINEDAYYAPEHGESFCAVADGMGGHNAGEVASAMAVVTFSELMHKCEAPGAEEMRRAVECANADIYQRADTSVQLRGMGTTFVGLECSGGEVNIAHVGDSRAYLIREGGISRVTTDHSLVEEMVREGLITEEEAKHHPKRNIITRALGTYPTVEVDLIRMDKKSGDIYLLCTDGLSEYADEEIMLEITMLDIPWKEKLERLIDVALRGGGRDNITALYAIFEEDLK
ncbi:MAG: Stp1/IreP family PP2C-type Ser/Thr phosphatase [Clostridia bacterium]|nr:Stp1/IreP family PP2C-type Ser/Thr phosphatase [Clostridia bacterium]